MCNWRLTYSLNSNISPGWQSKALQIASSVENLIAFPLPVFNIDKFAFVIPTFSASSEEDIFLFAIITSKFTIIAIFFSFLPTKHFSKYYCHNVYKELLFWLGNQVRKPEAYSGYAKGFSKRSCHLAKMQLFINI